MLIKIGIPYSEHFLSNQQFSVLSVRGIQNVHTPAIDIQRFNSQSKSHGSQNRRGKKVARQVNYNSAQFPLGY